MAVRRQSISSTTVVEARTATSSCKSVTYTVNVDKDVMRRVREHVAAFASPQDAQGARIVFMTFALWFGMFFLGSWIFKNIPLNTWWGLAVTSCWAVVRIGSVTRGLVVMHEAVHHTLFRRRWMNNWAGILIGLLNGVDAPDYQTTHAQHHHVLGIEEEVDKDTDLTVLWSTKDWQAWPRGPLKAIVRVMWDPICFFGIFAPAVLLALNYAWPHRIRHQSLKTRCVYVAARVVLLPALFGGWLYLATTSRAQMVAELLTLQGGLSYAMFIYCMEHVFEGAYRVPRAEYDRTAAALQGSSYMPMPRWWRWVTLGCEYHHIHHVNARVPCYRMEECEAAAPPGLWEAAGVRPLTARDGFRALILSLWDPDQRCYVPWPEWAWLDKLLAQKPQQLQGPRQKLA